ncbi:MAG: ABC transporter permease [Lachnospiraceae bacterium]|nr:ABC transporter permease [Lachnospiraceae bacterium]
MRVGGIIRLAADRIYMHKRNFLLTVFMLFLSFCMLIGVLLGFYQYNYTLICANKVIECDKSRLFKVEFQYMESMDEKNAGQFFRFMNALKEMEGIQAGKYEAEPINYQLLTTRAEEDSIVSELEYQHQAANGETTVSVTEFYKDSKEADVLFLDNQLVDICRLSDVNQMKIDLKEDEEYTDMAVGYERQKELPVGTKLYDMFTGRKYKVTQVLKKGSTFLPGDLFSSMEPELSLDDSLVTLPNDRWIKGGYSSAYQVYRNNIYYIAEEKEECKHLAEQVEKTARDFGQWVKVKSFSQLVEEYRKIQQSERVPMLVFVLILLFLSIMNIFLSTLISLLSQKKELGIMLACGITKKEIYRILFVENLLRFLTAFCPAYALMCFYHSRGLANNMALVVKILPFLLVIAAVLMLITAMLPVLFFRKKYPVAFR